jgi:hypothetical protein
LADLQSPNGPNLAALLLVAAMILPCSTVSGAGMLGEDASSPMPYLLLGTSTRMTSFNEVSMQMLESSPYNGTMLTPFSARYDGPVPTLEDFMPTLDFLNALKANSTKDIWPWIYLNRMIGYDPAAIPGNSEYFRAINGIDLYDATGARSDFEETFALALEMAKELGAPGIVIDLEAYNCENAIYHWDGLTYIRKESQASMVEKFRSLGRDLASIAGEEYPDCTILFLFTAHDLTVTEIVIGLLEGIQELGLGVQVIDGGEMGLSYWSRDLNHLRSKIRFREEASLEIFPYRGIFSLGGTIAPYLNRSGVADWLENNDPEIEVLRDFEPFFHEIFEAYDLLWVYASGGAGYRPFDPDIGAAFSQGLEQIIANYMAYGKKGPKLVENLMDEMKETIARVGGAGVDVASYNQSLEDVLALYSEGRYPEAHDLAVQTLSEAEEAYILAFRIRAEALVAEAEELIRLAKEQGIDTSRHELFFLRANLSLAEGNYQSAISMCEYVLRLRDEISESFLMPSLSLAAALWTAACIHRRHKATTTGLR